MNKASNSLSGIRVKGTLGLLLLAGLLSSQAMADRNGQQRPGWQIRTDPGSTVRQMPGNPPQRDTFSSGNAARRVERFDRGPDHYRSSNWQLDMRFQRDHYYPRRGSVVNVLPPGYRDFRYGDSSYYFQGGVWFSNVGANFMVTLPPIGIVIPILPSDYTSFWIGSEPYYYANDVYYRRYPSGPGYVVVDPPSNIETAVVRHVEATEPATVSSRETETAIRVVPSPTETPVSASSDLMFVYPSKGQSASIINKDRNQCAKWATDQTKYDPEASAFDTLQRDNYQAFLRTCLVGRGYSVK